MTDKQTDKILYRLHAHMSFKHSHSSIAVKKIIFPSQRDKVNYSVASLQKKENDYAAFINKHKLKYTFLSRQKFSHN